MFATLFLILTVQATGAAGHPAAAPLAAPAPSS